jgi:murein DD-endopeptidase MepM/ murein hydrolase activator NlpD
MDRLAVLLLGVLAAAPPSAPIPSAATVAADAHAVPAIAAAPAAPMAGLSNLLLPVQGVLPVQLVDTYTQSRGAGRSHDAIDIMAARGTPVFAVADGRVVKLFLSKPGGMTIYEFDPEEKIAYYYAHLDGYAPGLVAGKSIKRGEVIGYVGSTGNASPDAPHLHFAIFLLGPEKRWWQGTAINPFALLGGVSH